MELFSVGYFVVLSVISKGDSCLNITISVSVILFQFKLNLIMNIFLHGICC